MRYRWFDDEKSSDNHISKVAKETLKENLREQYDLDEDNPKKITRGEFSGLLLAIVACSYGFVVDDLPLMFAALSLIVFFAKPLAYHLAAERGKQIANLMNGFSIAMFLGAIAMVFI